MSASQWADKLSSAKQHARCLILQPDEILNGIKKSAD
jgi:hypothetical protein